MADENEELSPLERIRKRANELADKEDPNEPPMPEEAGIDKTYTPIPPGEEKVLTPLELAILMHNTRNKDMDADYAGDLLASTLRYVRMEVPYNTANHTQQPVSHDLRAFRTRDGLPVDVHQIHEEIRSLTSDGSVYIIPAGSTFIEQPEWVDDKGWVFTTRLLELPDTDLDTLAAERGWTPDPVRQALADQEQIGITFRPDRFLGPDNDPRAATFPPLNDLPKEPEPEPGMPPPPPRPGRPKPKTTQQEDAMATNNPGHENREQEAPQPAIRPIMSGPEAERDLARTWYANGAQVKSQGLAVDGRPCAICVHDGVTRLYTRDAEGVMQAYEMAGLTADEFKRLGVDTDSQASMEPPSPPEPQDLPEIQEILEAAEPPASPDPQEHESAGVPADEQERALLETLRKKEEKTEKKEESKEKKEESKEKKEESKEEKEESKEEKEETREEKTQAQSRDAEQARQTQESRQQAQAEGGFFFSLKLFAPTVRQALQEEKKRSLNMQELIQSRPESIAAGIGAPRDAQDLRSLFTRLGTAAIATEANLRNVHHPSVQKSERDDMVEQIHTGMKAIAHAAKMIRASKQQPTKADAEALLRAHKSLGKLHKRLQDRAHDPLLTEQRRRLYEAMAKRMQIMLENIAKLIAKVTAAPSASPGPAP